LRHDSPHHAHDDALATAQLLRRYLVMDRQRVRQYLKDKRLDHSGKSSR
jgi:hypothetical protein